MERYGLVFQAKLDGVSSHKYLVGLMINRLVSAKSSLAWLGFRKGFLPLCFCCRILSVLAERSINVNKKTGILYQTLIGLLPCKRLIGMVLLLW